MTNCKPGITLDPLEDDFVLRCTSSDGKTTDMRLSAEDVLRLTEAVPFLRDRIMSRLQQGVGTVRSIFAVPITKIDFATEMLGENLLMTVTTPSGGPQPTYALAPDFARAVAHKILERISLIRPTAMTKQ
jgi:hypothetical protein